MAMRRRSETNEPRPARDAPFRDLPLNGLCCSVCGNPQRESHGGAVCSNGHGGAEGVMPVNGPVKETDDLNTCLGERVEHSISDTVTVTWAEEKLSPVAYNTVGIGPFAMTTSIRMGETPANALERANRDLTAFAEHARRQKIASFKQALAEAHDKGR